MINYARERAIALLKPTRSVILATGGPGGPQIGEFPCEAIDLELYLLLPLTSDHLFNLERDERVALHSPQWDLSGKGRALAGEAAQLPISLLPKTGRAWYVMLKVVPGRIQVLRPEGWGPAETIDLTPCF
jgi:hypothetical protein